MHSFVDDPKIDVPHLAALIPVAVGSAISPPRPLSEGAQRHLQFLRELISKRDEGKMAPWPEEAKDPEKWRGSGRPAPDMPERLLALYARHPDLLEPLPGGSDVVAWIREARDGYCGG